MAKGVLEISLTMYTKPQKVHAFVLQISFYIPSVGEHILVQVLVHSLKVVW